MTNTKLIKTDQSSIIFFISDSKIYIDEIENVEKKNHIIAFIYLLYKSYKSNEGEKRREILREYFEDQYELNINNTKIMLGFRVLGQETKAETKAENIIPLISFFNLSEMNLKSL